MSKQHGLGLCVLAVVALSVAPCARAQTTSGSGSGLLSSLSSWFGNSSSTGTTTGTAPSSTLLSQQQSVVAQNIQQDAAACATGTQNGTIGYAINQAQQVHLQLASVRPNTDQLFSINNNCFTGLGQLLDLSNSIPSLSSIMGAAAAAVAQYAKQQVCQAVGQVTSMVTSPLNQAITQVGGTVGTSAINGMIGQQLGTIDPNLGSAWNSSATTNGSYTINANTFGINQTSFSTGSTSVGSYLGGSTTPAAAPTTTTTTTTTTVTAQQQQSLVGRLMNVIK